MDNIKRDIMKNLGEIDREEYFEQIDEDDQILANSVEAEARMIQAFSNMMKDVKSLKYLLRPTMGVPWGSEDMDSMKDVMQSKMALEATRQKLRGIVSEKMAILHKILEDVLGPTEKEKEAKQEMHGDHHMKKKVVVVRNTDYDDDDDDDEEEDDD